MMQRAAHFPNTVRCRGDQSTSGVVFVCPVLGFTCTIIGLHYNWNIKSLRQRALPPHVGVPRAPPVRVVVQYGKLLACTLRTVGLW